MSNNTITPITRNNLFYSQEDYEFEMELMEDYLEEDTNQTIVVYQVDRKSTQQNDIYKDAKREVIFKVPVEVPCLYEIQDTQLKSYDGKSQNAVYAVHGSLKVYINLNTFKKYNFDIKRGDFIGIMVEENRMYYWEVINDGKINISNQMILGAYKSGLRVIDATPVTDDIFKGL